MKYGISGWAQVEDLGGATKITGAMMKMGKSRYLILGKLAVFIDLKSILLIVWNKGRGEAMRFNND